MCSNLSKCQKMVNDVADTIAIDYAEELKQSGMSKEQIRVEVVKYLTSESFLEAVKRKVEQYLAKFEDQSTHCSHFH